MTEPSEEMPQATFPHWQVGLEDKDREAIAFALGYLANKDRMPPASDGMTTLGKVAQIATTQEQALTLIAHQLSEAQAQQPKSFDLGALGQITPQQWLKLITAVGAALPAIFQTVEGIVELGQDVTDHSITITEAFQRIKDLAVPAAAVIALLPRND